MPANLQISTQPSRGVPAGIIVVMLVTLLLMLSMANGIYLFMGLLTLYVILLFLWKNGRPGILVFCLMMQWAQVFAYPLWMNNFEMTINRLSPHAGTAITVSCIGLAIIAATISLGIKSLPVPSLEFLTQESRLFNPKRVLILYLFSTFFLGGLGYAFGNASAFTQILLTLGSLKWIFFMLYGYMAFINKKNRGIFILIVLFEFTTALYSYFSNFKDVLFYSIILSLTFIRRINIKQVVYGTIASSLLIFLMLTWTAIKGDYRNYLNQGKKQQVVEVSRSDAFNKIGEKLGTLTWDDYQKVIGLFLYRLQYTLHLAKTMDRVPDLMPYEYGQVWWENISYVLVPRLFWPDKPNYEATVKTNKYTGLHYSGLTQGSSFSLGYFADSYIDFGYTGMFMPLILLALFVVGMYRLFYKMTKLNILLRYGIVNVVFINFTTFEADGLFLFGRLLLLLLVFWFVSKYLLGYIQKWLYLPSAKRLPALARTNANT